MTVSPPSSRSRSSVGSTELSSGKPDAPVILVSFPRPKGALLSDTPFAGKLEMMLRLADVPFTGQVGNVMSKKHAPKRKFPVLRHGDNTVADSSCIAKYLRNTYPAEMELLYPKDTQRAALALALQRMLEEDLYFCFNYCIWVPTEMYKHLRDIIFADVPAAIRPLVASKFRKKMLRDLEGQGLGRHSFAYIHTRIEEELSMCNELLEASGAYLTGATPTAADCFLFALVDTSVHGFARASGPKFAFGELVRKQPEVMALYDRMRAVCFPQGWTDQWYQRAA